MGRNAAGGTWAGTTTHFRAAASLGRSRPCPQSGTDQGLTSASLGTSRGLRLAGERTHSGVELIRLMSLRIR